jgi:hypothetical protein
MDRALDGSLSPGRSVAAIGGMEAAQEAILALMEGRFPGKIIIFPQISGLPLMGLDELVQEHPEFADHLGAGYTWTAGAERFLIETFWRPEQQIGSRP